MNGLPKKLKVNGISYRIRTDYRDILKIIPALLDRKNAIYVLK